MLYFVIRYLHGLARIPGLPHLFDALLITATVLLRRSRLMAMEQLERELLLVPGICLGIHRFGGIEVVDRNGRELGHWHGNGLLDVIVGRETARLLIASGDVRPHHIFPDSHWVSFQMESSADVRFALQLLNAAELNNRARAVS